MSLIRVMTEYILSFCFQRVNVIGQTRKKTDVEESSVVILRAMAVCVAVQTLLLWYSTLNRYVQYLEAYVIQCFVICWQLQLTSDILFTGNTSFDQK